MKNVITIYLLFAAIAAAPAPAKQPGRKAPNVIYVLADEWRAQDFGYAGNKDVVTPHIDQLATRSVNIKNAISGTPVCCPYRGSLLTGQYPLTNGVFVNDVMLNPGAKTFPKVFKAGGYETAYIGKWHVDGNGRSSFIPKERRHGFDYWKVLECTHNYTDSFYWDSTDEEFKKWEGNYDAFAQTRDAVDYIKESRNSDKPFLLVLSWGPPHTPFEKAPEEYKKMYRSKKLAIRPNVPENKLEKTQKDLEGYYAHMTALDKCVGDLQEAVKAAGIDENTIFIFTSDHGHMVNSHSQFDKQKPYEESIHVPFLLRYPALLGGQGRTSEVMLNTPDIMPTLLGLCNLPIPQTVEGADLSPILTGRKKDRTEAVLISCQHPFGQWSRAIGGREYRGVRTRKYTYVRDLNGPWLLFDNQNDPYQLRNLVDDAGSKKLREKLDKQLNRLLAQTNDEFLPGMEYVKKWGYLVDKSETVPYRNMNYLGQPIVFPPKKP